MGNSTKILRILIHTTENTLLVFTEVGRLNKDQDLEEAKEEVGFETCK